MEEGEEERGSIGAVEEHIGDKKKELRGNSAQVINKILPQGQCSKSLAGAAGYAKAVSCELC